MKVGLVILISIFALPFQEVAAKPEIGEVLDRRYIPKETGECADDSEESAPCGLTVVNGIEYLIAYDEASHKITYIRTIDPTFITSDGLSAGGYIEIKENQITRIEGMDILGPATADGWWVLIGIEALHQPFMIVSLDGRDQSLNLFKNNPFKVGGGDKTVKVKIRGFVKVAKPRPAA
jgi:hypothetical protein